MFVRSFSFTVTEHDAQRPWIVTGVEQRTGAAMAQATATLERADRSELLGVLERLTQATQELVEWLRRDAR
jgi:hypothetical protein